MRTFRHSITTRIFSILLVVCMVAELIFVSAITYAAGTDKVPVSIKLTPETQSEDGSRTAKLEVSLSETAAAMIEISLTEEEISSLSLSEISVVDEAELQEKETVPEESKPPQDETTEGPDTTSQTGQDTEDTQTPPADLVPGEGETAADDSALGESEPPQDETGGGTDTTLQTGPDTGDIQAPPADPVPGEGETDGAVQTPADIQVSEKSLEGAVSAGNSGDTAQVSLLSQNTDTGLREVLIQKTDGSGVLRILVEDSYKKALKFVTDDENQEIEITEADILVKIFSDESDSQIPDNIGAGSGLVLLISDTADNSERWSYTGPEHFTVLLTVPEETAITANLEEISLDGDGSKDVAYTVTVRKPDQGSEPETTTFSLTWPEGMTRPAGGLILSGSDSEKKYTVTSGGQQLAVLSTDQYVTAKNLKASDSGLTFDIEVAASGSADIETCQFTFTVDCDVFERSSAAFSGSMTLSGAGAEGQQTVTKAVTVTNGKTSLPGEDEGYTVTATEENGVIKQTVAWADNEDEERKRPRYGREDGQFYPRLFFTINGVRTELTDNTLENTGLETWPTISEITGGSGFTIRNLPSEIQQKDGFGNIKTYSVSWSAKPPVTVPQGYAFIEVTDNNKDQYPSVSQTGWYYMLGREFTFTLEAKKGEDNALSESQVHQILSNFKFKWSYTNGSGEEALPQLIEEGIARLDIDNETGRITVSGMWKYNLDGSPITYWVTETENDEGDKADGRLTENELTDEGLIPEEGDWMEIIYDNSKVPNHGQDTGAVYGGGTLRLLLSGETDFSAEKRWLDESPDTCLETRPEVVFTLWRYREGEEPKTAATVKEGNSNVTFTLDSGTEDPELSDSDGEGYYYYPVTFKDGDRKDKIFPKYDPDGYAYVYGVKEEVNTKNNTYETLYGVVGDDDEIIEGSDYLPYQGSRKSGDTMLYDGGTLSNRLKDTVRVSASKKWEAAAYQAAFEDVAVELTLQNKIANDGTAEWEAVKDGDGETYIHYLCNFTADRLSESYTAYMPKYNAQGQELEYRWMETAVYQEVEGSTDAEVKNEIAAGEATKCEIDDNSGSRAFTLKQGGAEVVYISEVGVDGSIVNRIDDNIDYQVIKEWDDGVKKEKVTINIYRVASGSGNFDLSKPYVSFSYNEEGELTGETGGEGLEGDSDITVEQDKNENDEDVLWHATVHNLPRFDENGRPYEYVLLEQTGYPTYETERDEDGNYITTVFNGPGTGAIPVLVRKVWLDDGDDLHREPVTFTVYNRNTNQPVMQNDEVLTVTLGDANPGLWHEVVMVAEDKAAGIEDINDLYVVETKVGEKGTDHHLADGYKYEALYNDNHGDQDNNRNDQVFDVTTGNHRYQITYDFKKNEDASSDPGGVQGTFTVTNRRLGNIDLTVTKKWVDGNHSEILDQIETELTKISQEKKEKLALVFRLKFADEKNAEEKNWEITYTGFDNKNDTVCVGGENVEIYSEYAEDGTTYGPTASSEQVIIGYDAEGSLVTSEQASFFGLPKYDAEGKAVEYTVEELWLDVTDAGNDEEPTPVDDETMEKKYPGLWSLWEDYQTSYGTPVIEGNETHTKESQSMTVTNTREDNKTVTWEKVWKDDFTYNSNLRPDIYLDIYAVSHVSDGSGGTKKQIELVQKDVKWEGGQTDHNHWTVTLTEAMPEYDDLGYEIMYYAVERTVVAAGDYDYQAAEYSLDGTDLGTRDEPNGDAVEGENVLNLLDGSYQASGFNPADLGIGKFEPGASPKYPQYALIEGGTFTNALAEEYSIEGIKYWTSLPSGWPEARLPGVTFNVYRSATGEPDTTKDPIATLEISSSQWENLKSGLSYQYLIQYEGENTLNKNSDTGELICSGEDGKPRLARYDENGKLYTYKVTETVNWNSSTVNADEVFRMTGSDFTFTNEYNPEEGSIKVKKFLYLPMTEDAEGEDVPEAYPAVTFKLTRQVKDGNGNYVQDTSFGTKTQVISSEKVRAAYGKLSDDNKEEGYITEYVTFTNLAIYAPDGTEYKYTVTEDKSQLNGFETRAGAGDLKVDQVNTSRISIDELAPAKAEDGKEPDVQATFKNKQPDSPDEYTDDFTATKVWDDNNNAYGFRPDAEEFQTLLMKTKKDENNKVIWTALKRTAASQTGQNNGITEYLIPKEDFTVTVSQAENGNYSIVISSVGITAFDKYAPNGMPWKYSFSEPTVNNRLQIDFDESDAPENSIYAPPADTGGKWQKDIQPTTENPNFGRLENTTHMSYKFNKTWVDADGKKITENYLGDDFNLTVTFQLQVSAGGMKTWENASQYFSKNNINTDAVEVNGATQVTEEDWDTASITDTVNASAWNTGGTFENLPTVIRNGDDYISLQYRVIETSVSYGESVSQTISLPKGGQNDSNFSYALSEHGLVTAAEFKRADDSGLSTSTNKLSTTEVSVTKVWEDGSNQYNTRPGVSAPMTWTAWFLLQRTADGAEPDDADWENVAVVKLYGGDGNDKNGAPATEKWEHTFAGLPLADYSSGTGQNYIYRVRELQPPADGSYTSDTVAADSIVLEGGMYNPAGETAGSAYTTTYKSEKNDWTVTNALDEFIPDPGDTALKIRVEKKWAVSQDDTDAKPDVTVKLQYRLEGQTDWTDAKGKFEGAAEQTVTPDNLTAEWENLPSTIDGKEVVAYRAVEVTGDGWLQIASEDGEGEGDVIFVNTFTRDFSVEKKWNPNSQSAKPEVTLGLYRTTDKKNVGSTTDGEAVPVDELDESQGVRSVTLDGNADTTAGGLEKEAWKATFTDLPEYDEESNLYYYYALELDEEKNPIAHGSVITLGRTGYVVTYTTTAGNATAVTNTPATGLTGTKTWLDDNNEGNTRPNSLTLILERKTVTETETNWEEVTGVTPTWTDTDTATWAYAYTGLPTHDPNGNEYTYRVKETVLPSGYELKNQKTDEDRGVVEADAEGHYNFTNVRTGTVNLNIQKNWTGDTPDDRPGNIELKLERRTVTPADGSWTDITESTTQPAWTKTEGSDTWSLAWTDLDKYDENGVRYEYRVTENGVPAGYEVIDSTNTDPDATYTIQNIRMGDLIILKEVTGNRGETDRAFHFTVTLTGTSSAGTEASDVDGTYAAVYTLQDGTTKQVNISFTEGVSTTKIALKDGEKISIRLPAGLDYAVAETEDDKDGYYTSGSGQNGRITSGKTAEAEFENHRSSTSDRVTVTGTKTWVDDENAAGKRPDSLQLTLYRSTEDGKEAEVNADPVWTKNGSVWTYRYSNLPERDAGGKRYTYRVAETVPEGYVSEVDGYDFTNTLTEEKDYITLTGVKRWQGDTADSRPESITVVLYDGSGQVIRKVTVTAADSWSYRFENIPKYDAGGDEISYYVREEYVPDGYQVKYDGMDIVNSRGETFGTLLVTKKVEGENAEYDRSFAFTVTLNDTSINGVYGDMTFENGVAQFTLKHGETAAAPGLPSGIAYKVEEASAEGYTVSAEGETGEIPQNGAVEAAFVNTAEEEETELPDPGENEPGGDPGQPGNNPDDGSAAGGEDGDKDTVKTGDEAYMRLYAVLAFLFAAGLLLTLRLGRKRDPEKNEKQKK